MREAQPLSLASEHVGGERHLQPAPRRRQVADRALDQLRGGVGQRRGEPQGVARLGWQGSDPAAEQRPDVGGQRGSIRRPDELQRDQRVASRARLEPLQHGQGEPVAGPRLHDTAQGRGVERLEPQLEGPSGEATDQGDDLVVRLPAAERRRPRSRRWRARRRSANDRTARLAASSHCQSSTTISTGSGELLDHGHEAECDEPRFDRRVATLQQQGARHRVPLRVGQLRRAGRARRAQLVEGGVGARRLRFGGMGTEHPATRRRGDGREQRRLADTGLAFDDHHRGSVRPQCRLQRRELVFPSDDRMRERHRATLAGMPPQVKPG